MPIYNFFKKCLFDHTVAINLKAGADTIKCALLTSSYTPNIDTHDYWDDVSANEVSGTGYTPDGETLANQAVTQDNTNDRAVFDADDVTWSSSTITARYAVLYKYTGTPATSPLICYFDFTSDKSSSNADFTIQWNAVGIMTAT
jgi:hypothetical protein